MDQNSDDAPVDKPGAGRWSEERANAWYRDRPWPCGFNYLPAHAVNFVDLWHPETFDPAAIDRELGQAARIGYNTTRVNIQHVLWEADPDAMMARLHRYLEISTGHGISTVFCLFDDCEFSGATPSTDRQPDPIPGVHNSRALASPGREAVLDASRWSSFEAYVKRIVGEFADDERVLYWDLYNEPGNLSVFTDAKTESGFSDELTARSLELCRRTFAWARAASPSQPLTSGAWRMHHHWTPGGKRDFRWSGIDRFVLDASDITSFHAYVPTGDMRLIVDELRARNRPLMCTEWLARTAGSYLTEQLPFLAEHRIGCWQWGFVNGRSQTHIPWPHLKAAAPDYDEATAEWFHDVLRGDGSAYDPAEIALVAELTGRVGW